MFIFLLIVYMLTALRETGAIPVSTGPPTNPTIIHTVVFGVLARNACSDTRSSWEIIRSCLFTIAACVYRAIHPNIPDPNASFFKRLRLTIKITFYALMAPEMMIWWALRQRFGANIIVGKVNSIKPGKATFMHIYFDWYEPGTELKWTQTHGQFAQMGGFGRKDTKQVLYPETLIELLKAGQLDIEELQLTEKEINDKSKGDILSKALVAFQTTWFVFECLARLQQGLPLIELEVVTLAFATLNVITYAVWWYKPLNVLCPIYLHVRPSVLIPMTNVASGDNASPNPITDTRPTYPEASGNIAPRNPDEEPLVGDNLNPAVSHEMQTGMTMEDKRVMRAIRRVPKDIAASFTAVVDAAKADAKYNGWWATAAMWLLFKPFIFVAEPLGKLLMDEDSDPDSNHVSPFYAMEIPESMMHPVVLSSSFIGMVFGGIHFLAWHSPLLTHTQLILWRISSIVLVIQPLLIMISGLFLIIHEHAPNFSTSKKLAEGLGLFFIGFSGFVGTIPYVLARLCVLSIGFLTLRDLPSGAFTNISWTSYIPHL